MQKLKKKLASWAEIEAGTRRSWAISPVTKIIPDKRKQKEKHKGKIFEEN